MIRCECGCEMEKPTISGFELNETTEIKPKLEFDCSRGFVCVDDAEVLQWDR